MSKNRKSLNPDRINKIAADFTCPLFSCFAGVFVHVLSNRDLENSVIRVMQLREDQVTRISGRIYDSYAGSSLSGAKSKAQMQLSAITIVVLGVQLPGLVASRYWLTIKDTVADASLSRDIWMQNRRDEPDFWWKCREFGVHVEVHQECTVDIHAPCRLIR